MFPGSDIPRKSYSFMRHGEDQSNMRADFHSDAISVTMMWAMIRWAISRPKYCIRNQRAVSYLKKLISTICKALSTTTMNIYTYGGNWTGHQCNITADSDVLDMNTLWHPTASHQVWCIWSDIVHDAAKPWFTTDLAHASFSDYVIFCNDGYACQELPHLESIGAFYMAQLACHFETALGPLSRERMATISLRQSSTPVFKTKRQTCNTIRLTKMWELQASVRNRQDY